MPARLPALRRYPQGANAQLVLNVNTWVPPSHHMVTEVMMAFCKDAETATQGRVKCNLLPKAVVSAAADLRRGARWARRHQLHRPGLHARAASY